MEERSFPQLIEAARDGDAWAFRDLALAVQPGGRRYAASILRDTDLAEEAVQEALLESFQKLDTLRIPEAYPSWFKKIVFKQCDRILRRKRLDHIEEVQELPDRIQEDPVELLIRKEILQRINDAIMELSEADRKLAHLRFIDAESYLQIAKRLSVSEDTIKNRLRTIRIRLRHSLRDLERSASTHGTTMMLAA